jgi:hypothetical protein
METTTTRREPLLECFRHIRVSKRECARSLSLSSIDAVRSIGFAAFAGGTKPTRTGDYYPGYKALWSRVSFSYLNPTEAETFALTVLSSGRTPAGAVPDPRVWVELLTHPSPGVREDAQLQLARLGASADRPDAGAISMEAAPSADASAGVGVPLEEARMGYSVLRDLITSGSETVVDEVARAPLPGSLVQLLLRTATNRALETALQRQPVPPGLQMEVLERLARDPELGPRAPSVLATRIDLAPDVARALFERGPSVCVDAATANGVLRFLAYNTATPPDVLAALVQNRSVSTSGAALRGLKAAPAAAWAALSPDAFATLLASPLHAEIRQIVILVGVPAREALPSVESTHDGAEVPASVSAAAENSPVVPSRFRPVRRS